MRLYQLQEHTGKKKVTRQSATNTCKGCGCSMSDPEPGCKCKRKHHNVMAEAAKIACLQCDEVSTKKAWEKTGLCPKCKISSQGVAESKKLTALTEAQFDEAAGEKDACYRKVKSRYKVWPSAYASGALTKCRKVGAANWGKDKKK